VEISSAVNSPTLDHLSPQHRKIAMLGDSQRIKFIEKDIWISYPKSVAIRSAVRAIITMPKRIQAQCILVAADSGMGKSSLYEKVVADFRKNRCVENESFEILNFILGANPSLNSVMDAIFTRLGVTSPPSSYYEKMKSLDVLLCARQVKAILIDEFNHISLAGRLEQRKLLAYLKNLGGRPLCISIVGFGIEDAEEVLSADSQLKRRFKIYHLTPWMEDEQLRSFLIAYEQQLPIRLPSELWKQEKVRFLLAASGGVTGEIVERIVRGAVWSILTRKECIDMECLEKAAEIPPRPEDFCDG
jgi:hypothetical protein